MNNTFDIKRFGLLLQKDILENWKKYLMQALSLFGILLVAYLIHSYNVYDIEDEGRIANFNYVANSRELINIAGVIFVFAFLFFVSQMMDTIRSKQKRAHYLTFPCSSLEKYLSRFLIFSLGFLIIFFPSVFLADGIRVLVYSIAPHTVDVKAIDFSILVGDYSKGTYIYNSDPFKIGLAFFILIWSLYALGSTFWQRNGFVKTSVALLAIFAVFGAIIYGVARLLFDQSKHINIGNNLEDVCGVILCLLVLAVFNIVLSYFRFKETQIIEKR